MERYRNEFREATRTGRGMDGEESAAEFADLCRICRNHIRPHSGPDGPAPAEAAGMHPDLGPDGPGDPIGLAAECKRRGVSRLGPERPEMAAASAADGSVRVKPRGSLGEDALNGMNGLLGTDGFSRVSDGGEGCRTGQNGPDQ